MSGKEKKGMGKWMEKLAGLGRTEAVPVMECNPEYDLERQSKGETDLSRYNCLLPKGSRCWLSPDATVRTLVDLLDLAARRNTTPEALASRPAPDAPWHWYSWAEIREKASLLARGMDTLPDLRSGQTSFVAVCLHNCPLWHILERACYAANRVVVAVNEHTAPNVILQICRELQVQLLFCGNLKLLDEIQQSKRDNDRYNCLIHLVHAGETRQTAYPSVATLLEKGATGPTLSPKTLPSPPDTAMVFYTSTTDGRAKAVALTHSNFIAASANALTVYGLRLGPQDLCISYVPVTQVFQKTAECMAMVSGARICYSTAVKATELMKDMRELKPTVFPTLPHMLNLIQEAMRRKVTGNKIKQSTLASAVNTNEKKLAKTGKLMGPGGGVLDRLSGLSSQAKEVGGRIRLVVTGGAAVSEDILRFWRAMLGCVIMQGYGLTETCGAISLTNEADMELNHVGPPAPAGGLIRLLDVTEMNLSAVEGSGEILVKGPTIAKGYIKGPGPGDVERITDAEGWFHTGDVGQWTTKGCLRVIDRIHSLIKLPTGCFLSPEKVEKVCGSSKWIVQIFLTADPLKTIPAVVGVAVLDMEMLAPYYKAETGKTVPVVEEKGGKTVVAPAARAEVCRDPLLCRIILTELQRLGEAFGLADHEMVRALHLRPEPFTAPSLMTPSGKLRRHELRRVFAAELEGLYTELGAKGGTPPPLPLPAPTHSIRTARSSQSTFPHNTSPAKGRKHIP